MKLCGLSPWPLAQMVTSFDYIRRKLLVDPGDGQPFGVSLLYYDIYFMCTFHIYKKKGWALPFPVWLGQWPSLFVYYWQRVSLCCRKRDWFIYYQRALLLGRPFLLLLPSCILSLSWEWKPSPKKSNLHSTHEKKKSVSADLYWLVNWESK